MGENHSKDAPELHPHQQNQFVQITPENSRISQRKEKIWGYVTTTKSVVGRLNFDSSI